MTVQIRLSPSGPDILELGAGALLRLAEKRAVAVTDVSDQPNLSPFALALDTTLLAPSAAFAYRIEAEVGLYNDSPTTEQLVTAKIDVSYDGAAWINVETMASLSVQPQTQLHVHPRMVLGALPSFPDPAPASVIARLTLQKSDANAPVRVNQSSEADGIGYLSIQECLAS